MLAQCEPPFHADSGRAALPEDVVVQACDAILGGGLPEETNLCVAHPCCRRTDPH